MPLAHFSRVYSGTTASDLMHNTQLQIKRNCKPIEFHPIAEINLSPKAFALLCEDLSNPESIRKEYANLSIATQDGKWNCIVIKCYDSLFGLILYTSGRITPLYAAILIE